MGDIRRPTPLRNVSLPEVTRLVNHDLDNLERVHRRLQILELPSVAHGVEQIIDPQWATLPLSIPGGVGTTQRIADVSMRLVNPSLGHRSQLGVTVYFAPPDGVCSLYRNAADTAANATSEVVPMDTAAIEMGALSYDATNTGILCSKPGIVSVAYSLRWGASAVGLRQAWVLKNGTGTVYGLEDDAGTAVVTSMSGSALISVSAGDYLQLLGYQDSGGALAISVGGNTRLDAHYVAPAPDATDDVTLTLFCDV